MTDRFDAQLRQHLLENANERAAEVQIAAIVDRVAVTSQRRSLPARLTWWPNRIGPFPSAAVRYGLLAAALLAALGAAAFVALSQPDRTVFEGRWTAIDVPDGSRMYLDVGEGATPTVRYEDRFAHAEVCVADEEKVFRAAGTGVITGTHLAATFPDGGGCGLAVEAVALSFDYDDGTATLRDQDGTVWTRYQGGPAESEPPSRTTSFEGKWTAIDPGDGSTMYLDVDSGKTPTVRFEDLLATGAACVEDEVKVFTAQGFGQLVRNHLTVTYPDGGGCGSMLVEIGGAYDYDFETDTIIDQDGVVWTLVRGGEPLPPGPTPQSPESSPAATPAATSAPVVTETFTSAIHGLSIDYPAGWDVHPATAPWAGGPLAFDSPQADVLLDPALGGQVTLVMASMPLDGIAGNEFRSQTLDSICGEVGGSFGSWKVDGASAFLRGCGVQTVFVIWPEARGYVVWLAVTDGSVLAETYDWDWLKPWLETMDLREDAAVDIFPEP
jgi:hypothetical protein